MKNKIINDLILLAIMKGEIQKLKILLENNPDVPLSSTSNCSFLITSITFPANRNDFQCAALLIDHDVDLTTCSQLDIEEETNESHLHWITKRIEPSRLHIINAIIRYEDRNKKDLMKVLTDARGKTPFDYLHKSYHCGNDYQAYYDSEKIKYVESQKVTQALAQPISTLLSVFSRLFSSSPSPIQVNDVSMRIMSNKKPALKVD